MIDVLATVLLAPPIAFLVGVAMLRTALRRR